MCNSWKAPTHEELQAHVNNPEQILVCLVERAHWWNARVYGFEKKDDSWRIALRAEQAMVGRHGVTKHKKEGDLKSPEGMFALRRCFGLLDEKINIPYRKATHRDVWVDDTASPLYNEWAIADDIGGASCEILKRAVYEKAVVVEYNTAPVVKGAGSAIFIHSYVHFGVGTAGCTAVSERCMSQLFEWLNIKKHPVLIQGTRAFLHKSPYIHEICIANPLQAADLLL